MTAWRSGYAEPSDFDLIRASGARLYRFELVVSHDDGRRRADAAPPAHRYDLLVENAVRRGVDLLPFLLRVRREGNPPSQVAEPPETPAEAARWVERVRLLAARYGPRGRFWAQNPDLPYRPIRAWEVWNEPNLRQFWDQRDPQAREYARLLLVTRRELRAVDRQARVLSGGLSWRAEAGDYLGEVLDEAGACAVDAIAVHPYAARAEQVIDNLAEARSVADAGGARGVGLWVTEIGWRVGRRTRASVPTALAQARMLQRFIGAVDRRRGELGLGPSIAFSLRDRVDPLTGRVEGIFGLRRGGDDAPRPAWTVWSRAARRAGSVALPPAQHCNR